MTMDVEFIQHALLLAGVPQIDRDLASELSHHLSIEEEVLPHIFLRREGFAGWERFRAVIERAASTVNDGALTRRPKGDADANAERAAAKELHEAMTEVIRQDLSNAFLFRRLDLALTQAVKIGAAAPDRTFVQPV